MDSYGLVRWFAGAAEGIHDNVGAFALLQLFQQRINQVITDGGVATSHPANVHDANQRSTLENDTNHVAIDPTSSSGYIDNRSRAPGFGAGTTFDDQVEIASRHSETDTQVAPCNESTSQSSGLEDLFSTQDAWATARDGGAVAAGPQQGESAGSAPAASRDISESRTNVAEEQFDQTASNSSAPDPVSLDKTLRDEERLRAFKQYLQQRRQEDAEAAARATPDARNGTPPVVPEDSQDGWQAVPSRRLGGERPQGRQSPGTCNHNHYWRRLHIAGQCDVCKRQMREFVHKCPACPTTACADCLNVLKRRA